MTTTLSIVNFAYFITWTLSAVGLALIANIEVSQRTAIGPHLRLLPIVTRL